MDGVIHTAFNHDFSKIAENAAVEIAAIEALGVTAAGREALAAVADGDPDPLQDVAVF